MSTLLENIDYFVSLDSTRRKKQKKIKNIITPDMMEFLSEREQRFVNLCNTYGYNKVGTTLGYSRQFIAQEYQRYRNKAIAKKEALEIVSKKAGRPISAV